MNVANRVVDMISALCKATWCLKAHSLGEYVLVTGWKDTNKFHTSITDGTPVKGQLDTRVVSKASKPVSIGHDHVKELSHLSRR